VLSDSAAKAAYDNARLAREHKKRQRDVFEGRRRTMMEDLERRESGALKRKRDETDAEETLERELRRLQEDGRRRRMEREEALRKEVQRSADADTSPDPPTASESAARGKAPVGGVNVPELQRTVKVRWLRDGVGELLDKDKLSAMFSRFGKVDSAFIMKDRKVRLGDAKKKQLVGNGVVVFASIVGAHAAVEDAKKSSGEECDVIDSVEWAEGKEPDIGLREKATSTHPSQNGAEDGTSEPVTPKKPPGEGRRQFPGLDSNPSTPFSAKSTNGAGRGDGLRKVPSFASFKLNTPASSPFSQNVNSPSLEEITMIRLKNAEKRKLEEKIRREEAEAAAKEAEAVS
jgi:DnaJ family protein C protein 17